MSNNTFDGKELAEKLSKLNNSQQSIESLSRWCVSHRKKARQIVETWDKYFNSSQKEQQISCLYLANDILQTSKRKGSEFVNEFWKILPNDLKLVHGSGEHGKKVVSRLVDIWEERKVFGSRGQCLKDELLGKNPPTQTPSQAAGNEKSSNSNPIKILKRDAQSVRIKLTIGALPEKILTAFLSVLEELPNEEAALNKTNTAASHLGKVSENVENAPTLGNQNSSAFVDELHEQENILQQCIRQLESAEATRAVLISQLKEALEDQESKLELIRAELQVARGQAQRANNIKQLLTSSGSALPISNMVSVPSTEAIRVAEHNAPPVQPNSTSPAQPLAQPVVSYAPVKSNDEDSTKAAAAAMAAKLAASTSSALMLTSVLSSLVAEEAASLNGSLSSGFDMLPPEKRPKLEKPMPVSDITNSEGNTYFSHFQHQGNSIPGLPTGSVQAPFGALPPLLPPPPMSSVNPPANQYVQSAGMMVGVMSYNFGGNALPPPPLPPLPPHMAIGMARPGTQASQQPQPQPPQQQQQQQQTAATGGYYRPLGIGFYGQSHQSATQPVPRQ